MTTERERLVEARAWMVWCGPGDRDGCDYRVFWSRDDAEMHDELLRERDDDADLRTQGVIDLVERQADAPTADDHALSEAFGRAGTADTFIPLASPIAEDYANAERIADEARAIFCGSPTLPPRQRIVVEKIAAALAAARRAGATKGGA